MKLDQFLLGKIRAWKGKRHEGIKEKYKNSVRSIYGVNERGNPEHIGSCILGKLCNKNFLITAAHIIDHHKNTTLYVEMSELYPISGDFHATSAPGGSRNNDRFDFAWLEISTELFSEDVIDLDYVNLASELKRLNDFGNFFLALGYPNSKNKKFNVAAKTISTKLFSYSSTSSKSDQEYESLGIESNSHIIIKYEKKSKDPTGKTVNSITPKGISGGLLIDLGKPKMLDILNGSVFFGKPAGILIENMDGFLIATRLEVVANEIRKSIAT